MTRKHLTRKEKLEVTASAAAIHLVKRDGVTHTVKECLQKLLEAVQKISKNPQLTLDQLKESLRKWVDEGWAIIKNGFLQITHVGTEPIQKIAKNPKLLEPTYA